MLASAQPASALPAPALAAPALPKLPCQHLLLMRAQSANFAAHNLSPVQCMQCLAEAGEAKRGVKQAQFRVDLHKSLVATTDSVRSVAGAVGGRGG